MLLPGCVWDVAFLASNELVTGCADYVARVWTADAARQGAPELQEAFKAALAFRQTGVDFTSPLLTLISTLFLTGFQLAR